jgi:hypothetical protein
MTTFDVENKITKEKNILVVLLDKDKISINLIMC